MIYLKSILTGLCAVLIVAAVGGLWMQGSLYRAAMSGYVVFHWHKGTVIACLLAAFAMGFWWRYRKGRP
jgi:hypothetical protein